MGDPYYEPTIVVHDKLRRNTANYNLQTEAVRESIDYSYFTYFSEMSLKDYCIQTKKPKTLKLGTQVSTTLPYMEMYRDFRNSL